MAELLGTMSGLGFAALAADAESERWIYASHSVTAMLGYSPEEICALPSMWVIVAPGHRRMAQRRQQLRQGGWAMPETFDTTLRHKDGTDVPVTVAVSSFEEAGAPRTLVAVRRL